MIRVGLFVDRRLGAEYRHAGIGVFTEIADETVDSGLDNSAQGTSRVLRKLGVGHQHRKRVAGDIDQIGSVFFGDDVKKPIEVLQFLTSRSHRVVTEIVFRRRVDVGQPDRLSDVVRPQELFGIGAHRQPADARVRDEKVHGLIPLNRSSSTWRTWRRRRALHPACRCPIMDGECGRRPRLSSFFRTRWGP